MKYSSETERKIVEAASTVFLEKGKTGARMQAIADRAGINKALLHYYFRSKDRLYQEVFERQVETFVGEMLRAFEGGGPFRTFLESFISNYIDAIARRPGLVRFIVWEISQGGNNFVKLLKMHLASKGFNSIPIPDIIRAAAERGEIRPTDPVQLMISLMGLCVYPFIAQPILENILPGLSVTDPQFLKQRKQAVLELVWDGVKP